MGFETYRPQSKASQLFSLRENTRISNGFVFLLQKIRYTHNIMRGNVILQCDSTDIDDNYG